RRIGGHGAAATGRGTRDVRELRAHDVRRGAGPLPGDGPPVPRPHHQLTPAPPCWATEGRLLAAFDPDVLALDLAGVPYRQARRVGVHRLGQLAKADLLLVQIHRRTTLVRAGRTRTGLDVLAAGHDGQLRQQLP